jgi:hypothetical protein
MGIMKTERFDWRILVIVVAVVVGAYIAFTIARNDDTPTFGESTAQNCEELATLDANGEPRVGSESAAVQDSLQMVVRDSSGNIKAEGCVE